MRIEKYCERYGFEIHEVPAHRNFTGNTAFEAIKTGDFPYLIATGKSKIETAGNAIAHIKFFNLK